MRPLVLIGHETWETFGVAPRALRDAEVPWIEHRAQAGTRSPELSEISGIVLYGGSMNVDMTDRYPFLSDELIYIRKAVDAGVPYLGICLGSQMLARALDHPVYPAGIREIGFNALHPTAAADDDELLSVVRRRRPGVPLARGHVRAPGRCDRCSRPVTTCRCKRSATAGRHGGCSSTSRWTVPRSSSGSRPRARRRSAPGASRPSRSSPRPTGTSRAMRNGPARCSGDSPSVVRRGAP